MVAALDRQPLRTHRAGRRSQLLECVTLFKRSHQPYTACEVVCVRHTSDDIPDDTCRNGAHISVHVGHIFLVHERSIRLVQL
eukprot:COSAG01_NODE_55317_length_326_cov_0.585903_1_plen_81_part_01